MKRLLILLYTITALTSCDSKRNASLNLELKGNWYTDLKDGRGIFEAYDSLENYCEFYVQDSTLTYYEEPNGEGSLQKYFIKEDSIYKCFFPEDCKYIPMYKIVRYNPDTLWLTIHPRYANKHPNTFWVRLPTEEKGIYDHKWTDSTRDSLEIKISHDFDRRRWKFYAIIGKDMTRYDSVLKAGYWNFTMAQIRKERKKYIRD